MTARFDDLSGTPGSWHGSPCGTTYYLCDGRYVPITWVTVYAGLGP